MELPIHWHKYYEVKGHFVTYYGDIYPGYIYDFPEFPDSIFIIPPICINTVRQLQSRNEITREAISKCGHEIKDPNVIRHVFEADTIGSNTAFPDGTINGDQKWRQMFVFGAGASSFCVPADAQGRLNTFQLRPPISNELFSDKYRSYFNNYEGVRLSLSSLRRLKNDVETFLESEWTLIRDTYNPALLSRHVNILYYLQELFFTISEGINKEFYDCNLYSTFTDILQKKLLQKPLEKTAFVNFNYDTILDHYISAHFNVQFSQMSDYANCNNNPFFYFKPHGSSNWGWQFRSEESKDKINNTPGWLYDNKICFDEIYYKHLGSVNEMVHSRGWAYERKYSINKNKIEIIGSDYPRRYFPALLIPYRDKDDFVMPYYHSDIMGHFMNTMEDLFLIGWKGNEKAFNELLRDQGHNLKRIIIVNPNQKEVEENLSLFLGDLHQKYQITHLETFEDLVNSDLI